jgi:hypothetical protein
MIVNSFGNGVPVAFCYSTREDQYALHYFFSSVKEKTGTFIPVVFMSDDAPAYWNAFKSAFGCNETKQLLCSWHVDRNWRKKLNTISQEIRPNLYKELCILRLESNESKFRLMMENFLEKCKKDERTQTFAHYIESTYSGRAKL